MTWSDSGGNLGLKLSVMNALTHYRIKFIRFAMQVKIPRRADSLSTGNPTVDGMDVKYN
jgi:hypothetical protein